jgi:flagellar biosynthetic protein FlhB
MAEQEQNRSEPATPFKLKEAKKRGSVAKSLELNSLFALFGLLAVLYVRGLTMAEQQLRIDAAVLSQAHQLSFDPAVVVRWLPGLFAAVLHILLPLFLVLMAIAIVGSLVQTGPVFSLFPLKPDVERLNPVSGFKRLFSKQLLFELGKNLVKLALFAVAIYVVIRQLLPGLLALLLTDPAAYLRLNHEWVVAVVFKLAMVLAFIAFIDVMFTRWNYGDKLKMSRRELKEEVKQREGDPHVRARMRELQRELIKRARAIRRLPEADVLITNPTHLAVALLYRREDMGAPRIIAKGAGEMAEQMRAIARRHRVPVIEERKLARVLYDGVELDHEVPERLFAQVARILVRAYALRQRPQQGRHS